MLVYVATSGPDDPTRACLPIHLAVNGAAVAGIEAMVYLRGDATTLMTDWAIAGVAPLGMPPLKDLLAQAAVKGVPIVL